jgi:hypothetical protein
MLRTLLACGLSAVLLVGSVRAADPPTRDKQLDDIQEALRNIQARLDVQQENARGEVTELKRRMEQLEIRLRALEQADRERARVARAFNPQAAPVTAEITMRNHSAFAVTIVLDNQMTYELLPGETRTARRDVGRLEYEVHLRNGMSLTNGRVVRNLTGETPFVISVDPSAATVPVIVNRPVILWP